MEKTREKTVKPARKASNHLPTTLSYEIITPNTRYVAHSDDETRIWCDNFV